MYLTFTLLLCFSLTLGFPLNIQINRFISLVVFGDSYSDTGNVYRLTDHTWPIVPPYYKGRFCNGPNWVDNLNVLIKADYAYGGATTDSNFVQGLTKLNAVPVPGVRQQVAQYLNDVDHIKLLIEFPLYTIWAGGNDAIYDPTATTAQIVNSLMNSVKDLLNAGAKNLLIFNQPPAQDLPYTTETYGSSAFIKAYFTQLTNTGNSQLQSSLQALKPSYTTASINIFDLHTLITDIIASNSSNFTNTVNNCWNAVNLTTVIEYCTDPAEYIFLDPIHFSSTVQKMIANALLPFLSINYKSGTTVPYIIPI
jgi:outer membrane lipase/esterase